MNRMSIARGHLQVKAGVVRSLPSFPFIGVQTFMVWWANFVADTVTTHAGRLNCLAR